MINISEITCPIARCVDFIGDSWNLLILRDANLGLSRFEDFRKSLSIAPTMLTRRLTTLTDEGLLEKHRYSERPPRDEYRLTTAGRDFIPVLFMIGAWGSKHRAGGKLMQFLDAQTGAEIQPVAMDAATGTMLGTRPIQTIIPE